MSVPSVATAFKQTDQCSERTAGPVSYFVIHHAAMTSLEGLVAQMHGAKEVSAHFAVKDNAIISTVPPELRAWSLGDSYWDSMSITVETCNSATGDASGWPISEESYDSLAKLALWVHKTYGVPLDRDHIIGHREVYARGGSYPTVCPGGINLDRVVAMALKLKADANELIDETENDMKLVQIETGAIFLVTANGYRHIGDMETVQGLKDLGTPLVRMLYPRFIKALTAIHAADTANDSEFGAMRDKIAELEKTIRNAPAPKA